MATIIEALDPTGRAVFSNGTIDAIVEAGDYGHFWLHNHGERRIYSGDLIGAAEFLKAQGVSLHAGWIAEHPRRPEFLALTRP